METYTALGIMSGTSLDGLDLALCRFSVQNNSWEYEIVKAETVAYPETFRQRLANCDKLPGEQLLRFHNEYGAYIGQAAKRFLQLASVNADLVASHGHTVFHQPQDRFTYQIGSGAEIAAITGLTTVFDFRSLDVAFSGQGAPLVPIGDKLLFADYDQCVNLGGFANCSYLYKGVGIAYDICPVNIVCNELAERMAEKFDKGGGIGATGKLHHALLAQLDALPFYEQLPPKSLGREWVQQQLMPLINSWPMLSVPDLLRTFYEHVAHQLSRSLGDEKRCKILLTGGGAYNDFLIKRLRELMPHHVIDVPDAVTIEFKEALIFALLGVLRLREQHNCLASVTGAKVNNVGGAVFMVPAS